MHTRSTAEFSALLSPHFRLKDLEESPSVVFGLWADLTLAYMNPAWEKLAHANNGQPSLAAKWGLGAEYLHAIARPLREFYAQLLRSTPDAGESLYPMSHVYECSSASVFRCFNMQVYALPKRVGFVVINSLVVESPHDPVARAPHAPDRTRYVDGDGMVTQCAHCRRVRQVGDASQWDWVPSWVENSPSQTSHGLCPVCLEYYYPANAVGG